MRNMPSALSGVVDRVRHAGIDQRMAREMINCLDMTAVNRNVNPTLVSTICRDAEQGRHGNAASITIHSTFISQAFNNVARRQVPIGVVVNYPEGTGTPSQTDRDVRSAISRGAREIEIVIDHEALRRGDKDSARDMLTACRKACGKDVKMKVVMEGKTFNDAATLYEACCLAIDCGADMLVTGTAVSEMRSNTSLENAAVMLMAIRDNGRGTGLKIGGEMDNGRAHAPYFALARQMMGHDWVRPANFRVGGRALQNDALQAINGAMARPQTGSGI